MQRNTGFHPRTASGKAYAAKLGEQFATQMMTTARMFVMMATMPIPEPTARFRIIIAGLLTLLSATQMDCTQDEARLASASQDVTGSYQARINSIVIYAQGVYAQVYYVDSAGNPVCNTNPGRVVQADLWTHYPAPTNAWVPDSTCLFNDYAYTSTCVFRTPRPPGFSAGNMIFRLWRVKSDCSGYDTNFDDYTNVANPNCPPGGICVLPNVADGDTYRAFDDSPNTLVTVTKSTYQLRLDRQTGAIYEYYNLRSGANPPRNEIISNYGAAFQVDVAAAGGPSVAGCNGQTFWNPTQAGGCRCVSATDCPGYSTRPNAIAWCDGVQNPSCTTATTNYRAQIFQMNSFSYGYAGLSPYPGPVNAGDTQYLDSQHEYFPNYMVLTNALNNAGSTRTGAGAEVPTIFVNKYDNRYFYSPNNDNNVTSVTMPPVYWGALYTSNALTNNGKWVTIENTQDATSAITIACFGNQNFNSNMQVTLRVDEIGGGYKYTCHVNWNGTLVGGGNTWMTTKAVVFPYKYNETITSAYGTLSVKDTIAAMRSQWDGQNTW